MVSDFVKQTNDMAFTVGKEHFSRAYCLQFAETTLAAWLQGQERAYAVRHVIRELEELFSLGAVQSVKLIEKALAVDPDDDATRSSLITKALDLLGHDVRAEGANILRPGGKL